MRLALVATMLATSLEAAQPLPELPAGAIEKPRYWAILEERWRIVEPRLFTGDGKNYLGTLVRFNSSTVTIGKVVTVRTTAGTTAKVDKIPSADMQLVRQFRKQPSGMTVLGTITAIDPSSRTVWIRAGEIRPSR